VPFTYCRVDYVLCLLFVTLQFYVFLLTVILFHIWLWTKSCMLDPKLIELPFCRVWRWPRPICSETFAVCGDWSLAGTKHRSWSKTCTLITILGCSNDLLPIWTYYYYDVQVKAGSVFDNILICDDPDYAKHVVDETFAANKEVGTRHVIHAVCPWEHSAHFIYVL
jgi:hypothetical protein